MLKSKRIWKKRMQVITGQFETRLKIGAAISILVASQINQVRILNDQSEGERNDLISKIRQNYNNIPWKSRFLNVGGLAELVSLKLQHLDFQDERSQDEWPEKKENDWK